MGTPEYYHDLVRKHWKFSYLIEHESYGSLDVFVSIINTQALLMQIEQKRSTMMDSSHFRVGSFLDYAMFDSLPLIAENSRCKETMHCAYLIPGRE